MKRACLTVAVLLAAGSSAAAELWISVRENAARGTRDCTIRQNNSEYMTRLRHRSRMLGPGPQMPPLPQASDVSFRVQPNGTVELLLTEIYPRSRSYFLIGGIRQSWIEGTVHRLSPAALAGLMRDLPFDVSSHSWPSNYEGSIPDRFPGFAQFYRNCMDAMRSRATQSQPGRPAGRPLNVLPGAHTHDGLR